MTGSQKAIKIISIILIVVGIVALIAGLITFAGGMALVGAGAEASSIDQQFYVSSAGLFFVLGAGALISGVIDLLIGIFGLRGAKDPRKIGPFFVFSIIGLVLSILNLVISLTSGVSDLTTIGSNIVSVALLIGCVVLVNKVRQIH